MAGDVSGTFYYRRFCNNYAEKKHDDKGSHCVFLVCRFLLERSNYEQACIISVWNLVIRYIWHEIPKNTTLLIWPSNKSPSDSDITKLYFTCPCICIVLYLRQYTRTWSYIHHPTWHPVGMYVVCKHTHLQHNLVLYKAIWYSALKIHAGYSDTWDAGGTGERLVNSYLIVFQKWRNWTQHTAEWGHCCRGLVLVDFNPR